MFASTSIYIPRISLDTTEEIIIHEFSRTLGKVSRVDFAYLGQQPGFQEYTSHYDFKTCFVHFDYFYENQLVTQVMKFICDDNTSYKYYISINPQAYWLLLRARTVIPKTEMNIHQVVENARYLESTVEELTTKVDEVTANVDKLNDKVDELFYKTSLQQHEHEANMMDVSVLNDKLHQQAEITESQELRIRTLEDQLYNVKQVVYQLLGGLFNQKGQNGILQTHVKILYSDYEMDTPEIEKDDSIWTICPTTRQGDSNQERIEILEKKLAALL
jgi:outer membrane murein-binding lipoprotein Lpp